VVKKSSRFILVGLAVSVFCIILALATVFIYRDQILSWILIKFADKETRSLVKAAKMMQPGMPGFSPDQFDTLTHFIIGGAQGLASFADSVSPGEVKRHEIYVDPNKYIAFTCFSKGGVRLTVVDPKGVPFDSTAAERNKNSSYISIDLMEGDAVNNVNFVSPQSGKWIVEVSPSKESMKKISYELTARFDGSDINLLIQTDKDKYFRRDTILVTAILTKGVAPIPGAAVEAFIATSLNPLDTLLLYDDGTHGDSVSNDGRYTNIYTNTAQKGELTFSLRARKEGPEPFWRITKTIVSVTSRAELNGKFSDYGRDTNGDSMFEELIVEVGINVVDPDTYKFSTQLRVPDGPNGKPAPGEEYIASMLGNGRADTFLTAGEHNVLIAFDGEYLYEKHHDGPYQFEKLSVFLEDTLSISNVDFFDGIYLTKKYSSWDFQGAGILLDGEYSDQGLDINGNGLYDSLIVSLNIDIRSSDTYVWEATLFGDREGQGLDYTMAECPLKKGVNAIRFSFKGSELRAGGLDGPYVMTGIAIYGKTNGASIVEMKKIITHSYKYTQFE
jgi:hypothetical protein